MKKLILLLLLTHTVMNAQELDTHQWKERIIVVASPTFSDDQAMQQLEVLKTELVALKERKLVVYHVTNSGYTVDFGDAIQYSVRSLATIVTFKVRLIGLDGTKKFDAKEVQKAAVFFSLIDAMPMRKAEIKNKNNE